jgi:hypothetical protein
MEGANEIAGLFKRGEELEREIAEFTSCATDDGLVGIGPAVKNVGYRPTVRA